jgi:hypothetical protein
MIRLVRTYRMITDVSPGLEDGMGRRKVPDETYMEATGYDDVHRLGQAVDAALGGIREEQRISGEMLMEQFWDTLTSREQGVATFSLLLGFSGREYEALAGQLMPIEAEAARFCAEQAGLSLRFNSAKHPVDGACEKCGAVMAINCSIVGCPNR